MKKKKVETKQDVLELYLFSNIHISKTNQSLLYINWAQCNIPKVKDIWNQITNSFENGVTVFNKPNLQFTLSLHINILFCYKICINSWCNIMKKVETKQDVLEQYLFGNIHISKQNQSLSYMNIQ